ncbi:hypothetical protein ACWEKT_27030 [Nocardia takedensis]
MFWKRAKGRSKDGEPRNERPIQNYAEKYGLGDCGCVTPPFTITWGGERVFGLDNGPRFGEVTVKTCGDCATLWLEYWFDTHYPRLNIGWYRAIISADQVDSVSPDTALGFISAQPWWVYGGSYWDNCNNFGHGPIPQGWD